MSTKYIFSKYGLIGDNLELKQDIELRIDKIGNIIGINYNDLSENIKIFENTNLMIPSFINSHVHVGDSFAKEKGLNIDLTDVVAPPNGLKHKLLASTSNELKIKGIKNAALEMLSNGITCFMDFREEGIEGINILKEALNDSPIKFKIYGRFNELDDIQVIYNAADGIGLSSYKKINPPVKEILMKCKNAKKKLIACHCAELIRDKFLIDNLIQDRIVDIIVHGTQFLEEDLKLLRNEEISLILCPKCNGYFGVGFPPINDILKLNIPISLGSDNIMANNTDLFEEMRYLFRISRVLRNNNNSIELDPKDLLKMVTINAARIFNMENEIGSISQGKKADLFIIDLNSPNMHSDLNSNEIYALIVQRTKSDNIKQVFINGNLIFSRN